MFSNSTLLWIVIALLAAIVLLLAWHLWRAHRRQAQIDATTLPREATTGVPGASDAGAPPGRSAAPPPVWAGEAPDLPASRRGMSQSARHDRVGAGPGGQERPFKIPPRTAKPPPALAGPVPGYAPPPAGARQARSRSGATPPAASAGGRSEPSDPEPAGVGRRASAAKHGPDEPSVLLGGARSWGYQLQDLDVAAAARCDYDLLVIDYARDGSARSALKPRELDRLKRKPDGSRRLVYAYLSVGEAETYRFYWDAGWQKAPPPWLLGENPDWAGNHLVAFWHEEWRRILLDPETGYVARIAAAGFDGLYLDRCDVYEDIPAAAPAIAAEAGDLEARMVGFIATFAGEVRSRYPRLGIVMQNAEQLLEHAAVLGAIDGIAKEELLFGEAGGTRRNAKRQIADARAALDRARRDHKPVFCVEYLDDPQRRAEAAVEISNLGYVPYLARADRELATLETPAPTLA